MVFSLAGTAKTLKPFQQVPQGSAVPLPRQPGSFEHPPMASTLVHIINQQKMKQEMKGPNRGLLKSEYGASIDFKFLDKIEIKLDDNKNLTVSRYLRDFELYQRMESDQVSSQISLVFAK